MKDWNKVAQVGKKAVLRAVPVNNNFSLSTMLCSSQNSFVPALLFLKEERQNRAAGVRSVWSSLKPGDWLTQGAANYSHRPNPVVDSLGAQSGFYIFKWREKNLKNNILWLVKLYEIQIVLSPIKFLGTQPEPFIYVWAVLLSCCLTQSAKPLIFTVWPFSEKGLLPLG